MKKDLIAEHATHIYPREVDLDALEQRIDSWNSAGTLDDITHGDFRIVIAELRASREVAEFADHKDHCLVWRKEPCNCGLAAALAELDHRDA